MKSCKRTNGNQNVFSTSKSSDTISCRKSLLSDNTVYNMKNRERLPYRKNCESYLFDRKGNIIARQMEAIL